MTHDEQLAEWLKGNPIHGAKYNESDPDSEGECCPDFSCCTPGTLVDQKTRQRFVDANKGERLAMLMGFLGAAFASHAAENEDAPKVYVAGDPANYEETQ